MTEVKFCEQHGPNNNQFWPVCMFLDSDHEVHAKTIEQVTKLGFRSTDGGKTFRRRIYLKNMSDDYLLLYAGADGRVAVECPSHLRPQGSGSLEFIYAPETSSVLPEEIMFHVSFESEVVKQ